MRKLVVAAVLAFAGSARADVGVGLFVGDPLGLDVKLDTGERSAVELLLGWSSYRDNRDHYAHITYLVTPVVGHGQSVIVPLRVGIGAAIFDDGRFDSGINLAVRAPIELAFKFRSAPIEIYGELALELTFVDANDNNDLFDLQGGLGFRAYF